MDRTTYRILVRHGWIDPSVDYDEVSELLARQAGHNPEEIRRLAGWLGRVGRQFCGPRSPKCEQCPLSCLLPEGGPVDPEGSTSLLWERRCKRPSSMSSYQLEGPKPARMYEVILPKKLGYFGKVQEVLEDLFDEPAIRSVPFVKQSIARRRRNPDFDDEAWIRSLCRGCRGYSIYEMDGRYLSASGPVDERVLVIRFIFHNPSRPTDPGPTSWRRRWRWSITWWRIASPTSLGSRKKSGFLNITSRSCRSGAGATSQEK